MPLFEMPLEELRVYTGTNPRPADFDAFWDDGLAEMRALPLDSELIPASFSSPVADCFDLYFTGTGGARVHAHYLRPKDAAAPHPAVLMFHGYTGNVGDWYEKLGYAASGFSVFALDCRGQGGASEDVGGVKGTTYRGHIIRGLDDAPHKLLYRDIFLDTARLAAIAMNAEEVDERRVAAMGASQGGALTVACAALEPRVVRLAPQYPFLSDYRRVWEMDLAKQAYEELTYYFRMFDPTHAREEEVFTRLGYIDIQFLAPRIRGEVLWGMGQMDQVCPPSTQFAAYNRISSNKELVLYPDFGHEGLPGFRDAAYRFIAALG